MKNYAYIDELLYIKSYAYTGGDTVYKNRTRDFLSAYHN